MDLDDWVTVEDGGGVLGDVIVVEGDVTVSVVVSDLLLSIWIGIMRVLEVVVLVEEEVVLVVGDVGCSTFMFTTVVVSEVAAGAPLAATPVWLALFCVAFKLVV